MSRGAGESGFDERDLQRQLDQIRLLLEVNNAVVSHLDIRELFKAVSSCLREVIKCDVVGLHLLDADTGKLRVIGLEPFVEASTFGEGALLPVERMPGARALTSGKPQLFGHGDLEKLAGRHVKMVLAEGIRCGITAPLISHGRALGTLDVASRRDSSFTQQDAELLGQIANQVALAVENASNYDSVRRAEQQMSHERDRLRLSLDVNNAVVSHLDLRELVRSVFASLRDVMPHNDAGIALYDADANQLKEYVHVGESDAFQEGKLLPVEGTPAGLVIATGEPLLLREQDRDRFPGIHESELAKSRLKSGCLVPLTSHGRKLGVMGIGSTEENAFSDDDLEQLASLGSQVAIAVENALNYEAAREAQRRYARERDRLKLLLDVNNAIVSELDLRSLIAAVSSALKAAIQHDFAGLVLYDPEINMLRHRAFSSDYPGKLDFIRDGIPVPLEGTPLGRVFTEGRPLVIRRPDPDKYSSDFAARIMAEGVRSGCGVPLITRGKKLGVLGIGSLTEDAFTEDDLELLVHVSGQIAIAVENALNFERARAAEAELARKLDHLQLLLRVNNAVVSHLDMSELLHVISDCLREVVQHDTAGLALYEPEIGKLRVVAQYFRDIPPIADDGFLIGLDDNPIGITFMAGQPLRAEVDESQQPESAFVKRAREAGIRSACHVPLIAHGRKLGVIGVASVSRDAFSDDDLEMLRQSAGQIAIAIENALAYREIESLKNKLSQEKLYLEEEINTAYDFEQIIGTSTALKRILKQVETVAPTDSTVLILGETGTGKELIARAIHSLSGRRDRTIVKLNCAAIPTGLLESELFGHEKGAFTGAIAQRIGRFELANRGTLFLDEVGEIPLDLQPKLLRVLQEQEFERLGSTRTIRVDARLIAATNRDLGQMVADRLYRDDLYYRLNVFPITIPPLRERIEDIPPLVRFFASRSARRMKKRIDSIPTDAIARLQAYHWPGNIRELENLMERAAILTQGNELQVPFAELKIPAKTVVVGAAAVSRTAVSGSAPRGEPSSPESDSGSLESVEREHILRVLTETGWVVAGPNGAAARLGLKRTTLQARMKKLGIKR